MQDFPKAPNFDENTRILEAIRDLKGWKPHGANRKIADFLGVSETVISNWKSRSPIDLNLIRERLTAAEFAHVTAQPGPQVYDAGAAPGPQGETGPYTPPRPVGETSVPAGYKYLPPIGGWDLPLKGPTERDRWLASQVAENALRERGLFDSATAIQRYLLVTLLARGIADGVTPEELQRELKDFLDVIEAACRKAD